LKRFDKIIEDAVNGMFYEKKYCAKDIIDDISMLKESRSKETNKQILDCILYHLKLMENKGNKITLMRSDLKKKFNLLGTKVDCFAIPLDHVLLKDTHIDTLFEKVKSQLSDIDSLFSLDNSKMQDAFKYIGPFGSIAAMEEVVYPIGPNVSKQLPSLVIAKYIYSEEEAIAMQQEKQLLFTYFEKMEQFIDEWATTIRGINIVNAEVAHRSKKIKKAFMDSKMNLYRYRTESTEKIKRIETRLKDYKENQPYHFHFIANDTAASRLQSKLLEEKHIITKDIASLDQTYHQAKEQKENKSRIILRNQIILDLKAKYCHQMFTKVRRFYSF
jgi:hypothetical protein